MCLSSERRRYASSNGIISQKVIAHAATNAQFAKELSKLGKLGSTRNARHHIELNVFIIVVVVPSSTGYVIYREIGLTINSKQLTSTAASKNNGTLALAKAPQRTTLVYNVATDQGNTSMQIKVAQTLQTRAPNAKS